MSVLGLSGIFRFDIEIDTKKTVPVVYIFCKLSVNLSMEILDKVFGKTYSVTVSNVSTVDLKKLTKTKYSFNWKTISKTCLLYKLTIEDQDEILGVMALVNHPSDNRVEIKLIACSKENIGVNKRFEGIVECLIAYACGEALKNYGDFACVSLVPKTILKKHYMKKYNMLDAGTQVFLEGPSLFNLARKNLS